MPNVTELKEFYETPLGKFTCQKLRQKISKLWPEVSREKILGLGFALPYLPLLAYGNSCVAFMPSSIGAMKVEDASPTAMVDITALPARNEYFDRAVLIHCMENIEETEKMLEQLWHVMKPAAKILLIVPNDNSLWLKLNTPYKKSLSYTKMTLLHYLLFSKFSPRRISRDLFFIPSNNRSINRLTSFLGNIFWRNYSGVLIIEAEKLIFAPGGKPIKIAPTIWDKIFKPKAASAVG